jgi:hypothetical protein
MFVGAVIFSSADLSSLSRGSVRRASGSPLGPEGERQSAARVVYFVTAVLKSQVHPFTGARTTVYVFWICCCKVYSELDRLNFGCSCVGELWSESDGYDAPQPERSCVCFGLRRFTDHR